MTALTKSPFAPTHGGFGGTIHKYSWNWQQQEITVVYEILGQGLPVLMLPAFSTVSTRAEMGEIAKILASQFQVIALDWPGFGQSDRPFIFKPPWRLPIYRGRKRRAGNILPTNVLKSTQTR